MARARRKISRRDDEIGRARMDAAIESWSAGAARMARTGGGTRLARNDDGIADEYADEHLPRAAQPAARTSLIRPRTLIRPPAGTAAELQMMEDCEPPDDLVAGLIPPGAVFLAARPKCGKTILALDLAAHVARGAGTWLGRRIRSGTAVYVGMERTHAEVRAILRRQLGDSRWPRNLHVRVRGDVPCMDAGGTEAIEALLAQLRPAVLIVDAWLTFRSPAAGQSLAATDYHAVDTLRALAQRYDTTIIIIHHSAKRTRGQNPVGDMIGTHGESAAASAILSLVRAPDSTRGRLHAAGNTIADQRLSLQLDEEHLRWSVADDRTGRPDTARQAATEWLRAQLATGPVAAKAIQAAARAQGVCSARTLASIKSALGVLSTWQGRQSVWELPS